MIRTNGNGILITITKAWDYTKEVFVEAGDTVRDAFSKAGLAYEDWTFSDWQAYSFNDSFTESDNNWVLTVTTKQIKQG